MRFSAVLATLLIGLVTGIASAPDSTNPVVDNIQRRAPMHRSQ